MQKVGEGDEAAMAELYDRFVGLVYKTSRQIMPSRAEAEDAVQETLFVCGRPRTGLTPIAPNW